MLRKRPFIRGALLLFVTAAFSEGAFAQTRQIDLLSAESVDQRTAIERTRKLVDEVRGSSYLEIAEAKIKIETFKSESSFFKARFSITRYLTLRRLQIIIDVNPAVFDRNAPEAALRAIIAHELAHALYYKRKNWFELFGLVRLTSRKFTREFERKADLMAISRGYGEGLIEYRRWLYGNIPADEIKSKRRTYFSPEEIMILITGLREDPGLADKLMKRVPLDPNQLAAAINALK